MNGTTWNLGNTFLKIYIDFVRNDFSYTASYTTFPILLVFFLLGTICFLEPKDIDARLAISIGIFAFVFAYVTIVTDRKPQYIKSLNIVTFADFLLRLLLVGTTVFTISSVIGYSVAKTMESKRNRNKWIERIDAYRLYDVLAVVLALVISLNELVITNRYPSSQAHMFVVVIIVGLGWGLLCRAFYNVRIRLLVKRLG